MYDLNQEKIKKVYPVDMKALSYSAIPYKDGEEQLFSGTCGDFFQLPSLTLLNEVPISLWINAKEGTSGMSTLTELEVKTMILVQGDYRIEVLWSTQEYR